MKTIKKKWVYVIAIAVCIADCLIIEHLVPINHYTKTFLPIPCVAVAFWIGIWCSMQLLKLHYKSKLDDISNFRRPYNPALDEDV